MIKFICSKYKFDNAKKTLILLGLQDVEEFINSKLLIIKKEKPTKYRTTVILTLLTTNLTRDT